MQFLRFVAQGVVDFSPISFLYVTGVQLLD